MSFTREETQKFYQRDTFRGVSMFVVDLVLILGFTLLAIWAQQWYVQVLASIAIGTMTAVIFVVGHDAAHDSLTPHRWLNRIIGTICFFPSLHPYSLWVKLHNLRHHFYTNLLGKDDVWVPLDMAGYKALPWHSRMMYRFYRSSAGPLLYYLIEFWWKKFTWPTKKHYDGVIKTEYIVDTLIMWAFVVVYLGLLISNAHFGWIGGVRPWWNPVLFAAVLPFLIWNVFSGMSIYLHHTHPKIIWYKDEEEWRRVSKANTAVHAVFPKIVQRTFHFIQEHSVHHLRPSVPIYHLAEAQKVLEEKEDVDVVVYEWTFARHGNIARRCKLYDFDAKRWMDFEGNYTSPPPSKKRVETPDSPDVAEPETVEV
jgi:omega-6 fatty acid desaturase (delta-12 desaturase)